MPKCPKRSEDEYMKGSRQRSLPVTNSALGTDVYESYRMNSNHDEVTVPASLRSDSIPNDAIATHGYNRRTAGWFDSKVGREISGKHVAQV